MFFRRSLTQSAVKDWRDRELEWWVRVYTLAILTLTLIAWSVSLIRMEVLHWPQDVGGILYDSRVRFSDLLDFVAATRHPIGAGEAVWSCPQNWDRSLDSKNP